MISAILFTCLVNFLLVQSENVHHRREKRWFNTITSTEVETRVVTSYIPSSCVQVEATLPPCRNVRYLKFPTFVAKPSQSAEDRLYEGKTIHTTELAWGEYLGLYAPTATVTHTELRTTTVEDPRIVVTFAVKGCRPLRLPMDLDRCSMEPSSSLILQEILPTSTVASQIEPTANYDSVSNIQDIINRTNNDLDSLDQIQSSSDNKFNSEGSSAATEALPPRRA